ncbi:putative minor capsid protein [Oceanobacillus sp. 1P07AA]|uniref:putative minor capsid protein n=1 Tax=Oceanobacillus sp. 1P07AA TaxID=3132293 RepID=UPI0039A6780D
MVISPIPKHLLPHTIQYKAYEGSSGWDGTHAPPLKIEHVRVTPVSKLKRTANSEGEEVNHVVLVDRVNSSAFPTFKIRSEIEFNGVNREVVDVKPHYASGSEPHHYELELR